MFHHPSALLSDQTDQVPLHRPAHTRLPNISLLIHEKPSAVPLAYMLCQIAA